MNKYRRVLAIETSCDDTSVALVRDDAMVEICISADQNEVHTPFGGVVPEIASRNHAMHLVPLVDRVMKEQNRSWNDIDAIVVTNRPGLIGSLLVGVVTAKTLAQALQKPVIGVNHLEAHILAPFLRDLKYQPPQEFQFPFVSLAVSGGHTSLYFCKSPHEYQILGNTRDDAAGEAYDKFGQMLGLGFPGGVRVDEWAQKGNSNRYPFPRSLLEEGSLDFSFSGLKSAASRMIQSSSNLDSERADLCAGFQLAVVEVLMHKLNLAVEKLRPRFPRLCVSVTGGVSANSLLRKRAEAWADEKKISLAIPPIRFCTDNAAMVGLAGIYRLNATEALSEPRNLSIRPMASSAPGDFRGDLLT